MDLAEKVLDDRDRRHSISIDPTDVGWRSVGTDPDGTEWLAKEHNRRLVGLVQDRPGGPWLLHVEGEKLPILISELDAGQAANLANRVLLQEYGDLEDPGDDFDLGRG